MPTITLYTTRTCPYCVAAKRLLEARKLPYSEVNLEHDDALRQRLSKENDGYQTVPMIFIGERFIGGYTELAAIDRQGGLIPAT